MTTTVTSLEARPRRLFGKKCRFLRRAGYLPANLYGASIESVPVQVETKDIVRILTTTSRNTPVKISIRGEEQPRTAYVWSIQREPVTGSLLHIDFYHVAAGHLMRAQVPLVLVNVDPNLEKLDRRLNTMLRVVEVETLPEDLPTQINVDATTLKEVDTEIKVRDLPLSEKVHILTPGEFGVAKIVAIVEAEEEKPEGAAAAAEVETVEKKRAEEEGKA